MALNDRAKKYYSSVLDQADPSEHENILAGIKYAHTEGRTQIIGSPTELSRLGKESIARSQPQPQAQPEEKPQAESNTWGAIKDIGEGLLRAPIDAIVAGASMIDNPIEANNVFDPMIDARQDSTDEYINAPGKNETVFGTDYTREDIRAGMSSFGYSLATLAASYIPELIGVLVSAPLAGVPGFVAGAAVGSVASYRADVNGITRQYREFLTQQNGGNPLTDEEFAKHLTTETEATLSKHGLHEAGWEGVGNMLDRKLLEPLLKGGGLKQKAIKAILGLTLFELGSEAQTQTGQTNVEVDLGMQPEENRRSFTSLDDQLKSAKEVLPAVLLLSGGMGSGYYVAGKVLNAGKVDEKTAKENAKKEYAEKLEVLGDGKADKKKREEALTEVVKVLETAGKTEEAMTFLEFGRKSIEQGADIDMKPPEVDAQKKASDAENVLLDAEEIGSSPEDVLMGSPVSQEDAMNQNPDATYIDEHEKQSDNPNAINIKLDGRPLNAEEEQALEKDPLVKMDSDRRKMNLNISHEDKRKLREQRKNKRVEDYTLEEAKDALYYHPLTGAKNRTAYDESEKKPLQVSLDVDSLKWVNDNHKGINLDGDRLLQVMADAFKDNENFYHISGDEFYLQADTQEQVDSAVQAGYDYFDNHVIELENIKTGERYGLKGGFSYGTGTDADPKVSINNANIKLKEHKTQREIDGSRAERGEEPPGILRREPKLETTNNQKEVTDQPTGQPPPTDVATPEPNKNPEKAPIQYDYSIDEFDKRIANLKKIPHPNPKQKENLAEFEKQREALEQDSYSIEELDKKIKNLETFPSLSASQKKNLETYKQLRSEFDLPESTTPDTHKGKVEKAATIDDKTAEYQFELIELDDAVASHNHAGKINKAYPAGSGIQNRDRSDIKYQTQIISKSNKLNYKQLLGNPQMSEGAPLLDNKKNYAIMGNGRLAMIERAYSLVKGKADEYRAGIKSELKNLGINVSDADFDGMKQPIIIRRLKTELGSIENQRKFAELHNQSISSGTSSTEDAVEDAKNLPLSLVNSIVIKKDGRISPDSPANQGVFTDFIKGLGVGQTSQYISNGVINKAGIERLQNALFQKAFSDPDLVARISESTNPGIKNILNGMTASAGEFSKALEKSKDLDGNTIIEDIKSAVGFILQAKRAYPNIKLTEQVKQERAQTTIGEEKPADRVMDLAEAIAENSRSSAKVGTLLRSMGEKLNAHLNDKKQEVLFGEKPTLSAQELIQHGKVHVLAMDDASLEKIQAQIDGIKPISQSGELSKNQQKKIKELKELQKSVGAVLNDTNLFPAGEVQEKKTKFVGKKTPTKSKALTKPSDIGIKLVTPTKADQLDLFGDVTPRKETEKNGDPSDLSKATKSIRHRASTPGKKEKTKSVEKLLHSSVEVGVRTTGYINHKGLVVENPADVASLLSNLVKNPHEELYVVIADKAGVIINVQLYSVGSATRSVAVPAEIAANVLTYPNAGQVYYVHNHPANDITPSKEDKSIFRRLTPLLKLRDIKLNGVIVADMRDPKWSSFDGEKITSKGFVKKEIKKTKIPYTQRVFLHPGEKGRTVTSEAMAEKILENKPSGYLLLNNKLEEVGYLDFPSGLPKKEIIALLLQAKSKTNAQTYIPYNKEGSNVKRSKFMEDVSSAIPDFAYVDFITQIKEGRMTHNQPPYSSKNLDDIATDEVQYSTISKFNKAFKNWFGNSKVVDAKGEPLVVYHGTLSDFDAFDPQKLGKGNDEEGAGFYFSDNENESARYSGEKGSLHKVYLNISNPVPISGKINKKEIEKIVLSSMGLKKQSQLAGWFKKDPDAFWEHALSDWGATPQKAFHSIMDAIMLEDSPHAAFQTVWYDVFGGDNASYMLSMLELGYDGVIINKEHSKNTHYIAFNPTQIKAISNKGNWSKSDPRLDYQTKNKKGKATLSDKPTTLKEIQGFFPNQKVGLSPDGSVWVRTQNGKGLQIKTVSQVSEGKYLFSTEAGKMDQNGLIAGKYSDGKIELVNGIADQKTLPHEIEHWLEDAGIINRGDMVIMDSTIKQLNNQGKLGFELKEDQRENRAIFLSEFLHLRKQFRGTRLGAILQKIADFLNNMVHLGKMTTRKLASEIESGKIYKRKVDGGNVNTTVEQYEQMANEWYSSLTKAVQAVNQKSMPGAMWSNLLSSAKFQQQGVKAEEIEWSGVKDWLKEQKGKVLKQDVVDYLEQNQVVLETVVKGSSSTTVTKEMSIAQTKHDRLMEELGKLMEENTQPDANSSALQGKIDRLEKELHELHDAWIGRYDLIDKKAIGIGNTQYGAYQLAGGENYQEVLLTLPAMSDNSEYSSSHFDEKNIVAHIRMSEREVDGKRVLHLEEVQSDWHQEGRKRGYVDKEVEEQIAKNDKIIKDASKEGQSIAKQYSQLREDKFSTDFQAFLKHLSTISPEYADTQTRWTNAMNANVELRKQTGEVPNAPFKKNWSLLAIKKMVRYASENGFDSIAWTQGQEQADRYNLSKHIEKISYTRAKVLRAYDKAGNRVMSKKLENDSEIADHIGKEVANKLLALPMTKINKTEFDPYGFDGRELAGQDLQVGGEGMKTFYDKMLPNEVNKFFNKKAWGKAKVGEVEVRAIDPKTEAALPPSARGTGVATTKLHSLPITPEMKSKALREGMPMFQAVSNTATNAFKKWFKGSKIVDAEGNPLVVYHGTTADFNIFNDSKHGQAGRGMYFSPYKTEATMYGNNVKSAYLSLKNPRYIKRNEIPYDLKAFRSNNENLGYDGVIVMGAVTNEIEEIVAYQPTQIKSVHNKGTFDGNNPDIQFSTIPTGEEAKKIYKGLHAGVKKMWTNRKQKDEDVSGVSVVLSLMSHYSGKVLGLKKTFEAILESPRFKYEKINDLSKEGEESLIGRLQAFEKSNKEEYKQFAEYLVKADRDQNGAIIKEEEDGWQVLVDTESTNPKTNETFKRREAIATKIKDKATARHISLQHELSELDGWTTEAKEAVYAFRTIAYNLHDHFAGEVQAMIKDYESRGLTLPKITTETSSGVVQIDLKQALAKMGDRSGYYFPRLRGSGDFKVTATKKGEQTFVQFRDTLMFANKLAGKKESEGYTTKVKKVGSFSEDMFTSIKDVLNVQSSINQAVMEIAPEEKRRNLSSLGMKGVIKGKKYYLIGGAQYGWSSHVLESLGGEYFEYNDGKNFQPSYKFDINEVFSEEVLKSSLYQARGHDTDISFEFSRALAEQISDELKSRGSRSVMIKRSDAVGLDVTAGYEEDPIKAIGQAVTSAAGGYAKGQVAQNAVKAITGREFSWEEYQEMHPDRDKIEALESQRAGLSKNNERELGQIALLKESLRELHRERTAVQVESDKNKEKRLERIKAVHAEINGIEAWKDKKQAAILHFEIAKLKAEMYKEYHAEVSKKRINPKTQKRAYNEAVSAVENVLRNDEAVDRLLGTLKGLASVWFLGGKISSATINLTSMGTSVPASMKVYGGIPLRKAMGLIRKGSLRYMQYKTGKGSLSEDDKKFFDEVESRGWMSAQLNMEAVSAVRSGPAKGYAKGIEWLMTPFKITEEFNRGATLYAAYKGIVTQNPTFTMEQALKQTKEVSDKAHGIYGKENQPSLLRHGKGLSALSSMYIFQTYMHNYFATMAQAIGRGEAKAALYMILSPAIFGGISTSSAMLIVNALTSLFGGDDPEEEIYKIAEELFGSSGETVARYGLPGLAGISLKGSLALNLPDLSKPSDLLGPIGGMFENMIDGVDNISHGNYLKGAEKVTPDFIGNIVKGYREVTEGVTTKNNQPVFFGNKQIKGDAVTGGLRMLGFNPTKIARPREIQWNETKKKRKYQERKTVIYNSLRKFYSTPKRERTRADWDEIQEEIRDLNARINRNGLRRIISPITRKTIKTAMKRSFRPPKRERERAVKKETAKKILKSVNMDSVSNDKTASSQQFVADLDKISTGGQDEVAYYKTRANIQEYKKKHGLAKVSKRPIKKSNAMYYYEQSMKYGDLLAARGHLDKYYELGGSPRTIRAIKRAYPLSGIKKEDRYKFRQSLSSHQEIALQQAIKWYKEV